MNTIIKGDNLMLFDAQGRSIGLATAHTLTITGETVDINTKDHGIWGSTEMNKINWEITTDNLYSTSAFNDLFDKMLAREAVDIYFGLKSETGNGTVDEDGTPISTGSTEKTWTKGNNAYKGKAFITSLTANANSGDNATFSATFSGVGSLTREQ